jgi:hypothetical protein
MLCKAFVSALGHILANHGGFTRVITKHHHHVVLRLNGARFEFLQLPLQSCPDTGPVQCGPKMSHGLYFPSTEKASSTLPGITGIRE